MQTIDEISLYQTQKSSNHHWQINPTATQMFCMFPPTSEANSGTKISFFSFIMTWLSRTLAHSSASVIENRASLCNL
jgi:hypothetical protein